MTEYIDRQAVFDELDEDIEEFVERDYALKVVKKYIKKIPPAGVRPTTHGKWIPVTLIRERPQEWADATEPDEIDALKCSECGEIFDFTEARNWCPECGSCMKGKE